MGIFLVFFPIRQVEGDPLHGDAAHVALWQSACSWSLLQSYSLADYLPGACFCFVVGSIVKSYSLAETISQALVNVCSLPFNNNYMT